MNKRTPGLLWPHFVVLVCAATTGSLRGEEKAMSIGDIAKANRRAISSIRSIVVEGKGEMEITGPEPVRRYPAEKYTWTWQGDKVRMEQLSATLKDRDGDAGGAEEYEWTYLDFYNGPDGYKELLIYNPGGPSVITETQPGRASGIVDSTRPKPYGAGNPNSRCLFTFGGWPNEASLSDLIGDAGNRCSIRERPSQSNGHCYVLEVAVTKQKVRYVVWVDPTASFLVRKLERFDEAGTLSSRAEVLSFTRCDGGVVIPKAVNFEAYQGSKTAKPPIKIAFYVDISVKQVNQKLGKGAFEVRFPEWLRVSDRKTGQYYLWGTNGPRRVFKNIEEFRAFELQNLPHPDVPVPPQSK